MFLEGGQNIYVENKTKKVCFSSFAQAQAFTYYFSIMFRNCAQKPENKHTPNCREVPISNVFQLSADHPLYYLSSSFRTSQIAV